MSFHISPMKRGKIFKRNVKNSNLTWQWCKTKKKCEDGKTMIWEMSVCEQRTKRMSMRNGADAVVVVAAEVSSLFSLWHEMRHCHISSLCLCVLISAQFSMPFFCNWHSAMCAPMSGEHWRSRTAGIAVFIHFRFKVTWWYYCHSVCSHPLSFYSSKENFPFKHVGVAILAVVAVVADVACCCFDLNSSCVVYRSMWNDIAYSMYT